jgi:transposase-like protein
MTTQSMKHIPAVAQDELRNRLVAALKRGVTQAARVFGITDRSIRRWVKQMRESGTDRVEPKKRGRIAGTVSELKPHQAERIKAMVIGRVPDQKP